MNISGHATLHLACSCRAKAPAIRQILTKRNAQATAGASSDIKGRAGGVNVGRTSLGNAARSSNRLAFVENLHAAASVQNSRHRGG